MRFSHIHTCMLGWSIGNCVWLVLVEPEHPFPMKLFSILCVVGSLLFCYNEFEHEKKKDARNARR